MLRRSLSSLSRLFRKGGQLPDIASAELPDELKRLISAAYFQPRSYGEEPRVIVMFNGYQAFLYSRGAFGKFLSKFFPDLDDANHKRAIRYIESSIVDYLKGGRFPPNVVPESTKKRNRWMNSW